MFKQHPPQHPSNVLPVVESPEVIAWIETWPQVRHEVLSLIAGVQERAEIDTSSFEFMVEEVDQAMRLLHYRVGWLRNRLNEASNQAV